MNLARNLRPRLRLLRAALTRRFIYPEVTALAADYGMEYRDVAGDVEPFEFADAAAGRPAPAGEPDFAAAIGPAESFTPPGAPASFNSEPSVGRFLGKLAFRGRARTVVELGCFVGWTTAHLALALKASGGGRLYAVDYMQEYLDAAMGNLRRLGLDGPVTPVRGMSRDADVLAALPRGVDLVFLDTGHAHPETREEILAYAPLLAPGGRIVLHDSTSAPGVRRSLADLRGRFRALTFGTEGGNGVTVLLPRLP